MRTRGLQCPRRRRRRCCCTLLPLLLQQTSDSTAEIVNATEHRAVLDDWQVAVMLVMPNKSTVGAAVVSDSVNVCPADVVMVTLQPGDVPRFTATKTSIGTGELKMGIVLPHGKAGKTVLNTPGNAGSTFDTSRLQTAPS